MKTNKLKRSEYLDKVSYEMAQIVTGTLQEAQKISRERTADTAMGIAEGVVIAIGEVLNPIENGDKLDHLGFFNKLMFTHLAMKCESIHVIHQPTGEEFKYE